jgi:hypothetical protein
MVMLVYSFAKKYSLILFTVLCGMVNSYSQKYAGEMPFQNEAVKIDGKSNEWTFPLPLYDPKTKLNFSFSNDSKRVYFTFVANSEITRYKIINAGLTLEIDAEGGKKYPTEITFLPNALGYRPPPKAYRSRTDSLGQLQVWTIPVNIKGKGLKNLPDGLFSPNNKNGIEIAMIPNDDIDRLFCELSIPFSLFYKDSLKDSGVENTFSVKITVNKIASEGNSLMDDGTGVSVTGSMGGGRYTGASGSYQNGGGYGGMNGGYPNGGGGYPNGGGGYPNNGAGGYPEINQDGSTPPVSNTNNSELNLKTTFTLKLKPSTPPTK